MLSCIVTAYKEPTTIGAAIEALIAQDWQEEYEILVACPDQPTADVVLACAQKYPQVQHLRDSGEGKPAALNLALQQAHGRICIFTDGDVKVLPNAIQALLAPFADTQCGAVTGRPVSASPRSTMLGYWSHLLTDAGAHTVRMRRSQQGLFLDCSGYLYAARRELLSPWPANTLADDAYISQYIWQQGYQIAYAPKALVAVRYPTTYHDWLLQKVRSTAGAATIVEQAANPLQQKRQPVRMRSFFHEAIEGFRPTLAYPRALREFWWTCALLLARLHLWLRIMDEVHIKRRSYKDIWQRVESTK
jgi:cellulose synthase/poly-beta-1,6-N-acetylglucosamine synthase-like glycosyltransferase